MAGTKLKYLLLGGIIGDICGSVYEYSYGSISDIRKELEDEEILETTEVIL